MTDVRLVLTPKQYEHLKSVLVWADMYDRERLDGKNQAVYEEILKGFNYLGGAKP